MNITTRRWHTLLLAAVTAMATDNVNRNNEVTGVFQSKEGATWQEISV